MNMLGSGVDILKFIAVLDIFRVQGSRQTNSELGQAAYPLEAPFIPGLLQKIFASTHWYTINLVICAHQAAGTSLLDAGLERSLVRVLHILCSYLPVAGYNHN